MASDTFLSDHLELPEIGRVKQSDPVFISISEAYLCLDCNCIGNYSGKCSHCSSVAIKSLASIINRKIKPPSERVQNMISDLDKVIGYLESVNGQK